MLALAEKFLRFHLQDKHNVSSFFLMSWVESPLSIDKDM